MTSKERTDMVARNKEGKLFMARHAPPLIVMLLAVTLESLTAKSDNEEMNPVVIRTIRFNVTERTSKVVAVTRARLVSELLAIAKLPPRFPFTAAKEMGRPSDCRDSVQATPMVMVADAEMTAIPLTI